MGSLHGPAPGPQRNPSLLPLREGVDGVQDSERGRNRDLKVLLTQGKDYLFEDEEVVC